MAGLKLKIFVEPIGVLDTTFKRIMINCEPHIPWDELMKKIFDKIRYPRDGMTLWRLVKDKEKWEEFTKEKEEKAPIKHLDQLRAVKVSMCYSLLMNKKSVQCCRQ